MQKKKILMFTDWYEPGYKGGGPIQSCRNIVETFKENFNFYIFTSDRDLGETSAYPGIAADRWTASSESVKIWYTSPGFLSKRQIERLMNELGPDIVYFNSMFSPRYTLLPLWILLRNHFKGKIILAPRGMLHKGAMLQKNLKKNIFLRIFKLLGLHRKILFHATGQQEQRDIASNLSIDAMVIVAENIPNAYEEPWKERPKSNGQLDCVFISRIEPKKNLHYFLELLNKMEDGSRINLDIYGEEEDLDYARLCREMAGELRPPIQTRFMGALPHSRIFDTLLRYQLFVLPTLGENFGHAIFEALSSGCPVLISDQTPWLNLPARKLGWDIPLIDSHQFMEALRQVLYFDQAEYNIWSKNAFHFASDFFNRLDTKTEYLKLFS